MCCNGGPRTALAAVELLLTTVQWKEERKTEGNTKSAQRKQETRNEKKANIKVRAVKRETARSNEVRI